MLATFILHDTKDSQQQGIHVALNINPTGYNREKTLFNSLKVAIEWAIAHDEDVIYCICGEEVTTMFDFDILEKTIHEMASEGINFLYIDTSFKESIVINQYCNVIGDIETVSSFILMHPLYRFVLSALEVHSDLPETNWLRFLRFIAPHAFALSDNKVTFNNNVKFHLISPFRNAGNYIQEYWHSINRQVYHHYHVHLVDDCSVDGSSDIIGDTPFLTKTINTERKYALQNIIDVLLLRSFQDDDVICLVDADDKLPHKYVLSILHSVYQDCSTLLTYGSGQFVNEHRRFGSPYTEEEFESLRESSWKASHLRTFRYKLFKELIRQDPELVCLRNASGQILRMPYDMALMFPLMELAGYKHIKFIYTPLYQYRRHENNDQYVNRAEQYAGEKEIRKKPKLTVAF